jgi:squalene-associated FAD-dependent desaturase
VTGPVHVIGGGFAGAAAAVRLAEAGVPVVLWEAGPAPGGRAGGFADRASGEVLDTGPHLLSACYHRTRKLLARLGTADAVAFQGRLHIPLRVNGRSTALACPPLPGTLGPAFGLLGLAPLGAGDRLRLLAAGRALGRPAPRGATVAAWLAAIGMPAAAVPLLWDPLCRAVMNLPPDEAAAEPFARALHQALLGPPADARLGWARHGLAPLLAPLGDYLERRGGMLRQERVTGIEVDADGRVTGLTTAGERVPASRVVLATDPFAARPLLARVPRLEALAAILAALRPAAIVSTYLWLDRPAVPFDPRAPFVGLVGAGEADGLEWLFDRDRMAGTVPTAGQRLAAVASAADVLEGLPAGTIAERVRDALARRFPEAGEARVRGTRVVKARHATVRLGPDTVRPAPGGVAGAPGLFLCGDYTDTGLPATIEGAVVSGEAAAGALLAGP